MVGFGEDITVSCTTPFDKTELENFCVSLDHNYLIKKGPGPNHHFLPKWLSHQDQDFIGTYSNANPDKMVEEWSRISSDLDAPDFIGKSRVWNPTMKRCEGMTTMLRYRFFWTYEGSLYNPQAKILR